MRFRRAAQKKGCVAVEGELLPLMGAGKDAEQQKITFPAVYGLSASRAMAERECARAHQVLEPFGPHAAGLHELADLIVHRKT